jgi:hypothetical protein
MQAHLIVVGFPVSRRTVQRRRVVYGFSRRVFFGETASRVNFWSVEDLVNKSDGVRLVRVTGRTCTVTPTRRNGELGGGDEGEEGVESVFGMVDGREQPGINQWVRQHRHLFGKKKVVAVVAEKRGSAVDNKAQDDSDDDDDDFQVHSEDSDGGSPSSDSSDESGEVSEGGSGSDNSEGSGDEEDEGRLKEKNHPLLRPGAMPRMSRMSRGAIESVISMMEEDFVGGSRGGESDELQA